MIIAYNKVTFQPKVIHISPTIMGLSNGETNKKVRVGLNRLSLTTIHVTWVLSSNYRTGNGSQQSSQEIASPFSGPHHLLDFMVWHLCLIRLTPALITINSNQSSTARNTNISAASCSIASQLLIRKPHWINLDLQEQSNEIQIKDISARHLNPNINQDRGGVICSWKKSLKALKES